MFLVWYALIPGAVALLGYFPASKLGLGQDLPAGVALHWACGGRHRNYILDLYGKGECDHFAQFAAPIKLYSFSDDDYAPRETVEALLHFYPNAPGTHHHVRPSEVGLPSTGHFGFFRSGLESSLWAESVEWLLSQ